MAKGDSRRPNRLSPRPSPQPSATSKPPANGPAAPGSAGPRPARAPQCLPQRPSQRLPQPSAPPLTSRTTTLDDPLTTSLLAEIARRPSTVEMSPAQIAEAAAKAPGAPEPERCDDRDPDDPP